MERQESDLDISFLPPILKGAATGRLASASLGPRKDGLGLGWSREDELRVGNTLAPCLFKAAGSGASGGAFEGAVALFLRGGASPSCFTWRLLPRASIRALILAICSSKFAFSWASTASSSEWPGSGEAGLDGAGSAGICLEGAGLDGLDGFDGARLEGFGRSCHVCES